MVLALLPACSQEDAAAPASAPAEAPALAPGKPADVGGRAPAADRALRITTETTLRSADVAKTAALLRQAANDFGGFVSDARVSGGDDVRSASLELRIPAERLEELRAGFSQYGTILSDSEKAEDVTEQRADLSARLRNARAQEKRLLDLLSDRTGSLADVIAAEKALAEIRDTIERLDAQHEVLEGQIKLATVKIQIVRDGDAVPKTAGDRISNAGGRGLTLAGDAAVGVVVFAATAGPTLLLFLGIFLGFFFTIRKIGRRFGWWTRSAMRPPVWYGPRGPVGPMAAAPAAAVPPTPGSASTEG
ncbi:MAG: DUF4349 domain-containing protein [Polyangiaceae bacterium]|nr:DUF4349 domain-containing protein [Polyangiaceae bacterium]